MEWSCAIGLGKRKTVGVVVAKNQTPLAGVELTLPTAQS
jgi:hypothetical protein